MFVARSYGFCSTFPPRYVHNNIFFSFAVDADIAQLSSKKALDTYSKTENTGLKHDSSELIDNNLSNGGNSISDKSGACTSETINGVSDLAHDIPAETQLMESEQATYASANNDLKGTKAYQEADVSGLYNLAMAIIDYRGHRVVAQVSKFPGFSLFNFVHLRKFNDFINLLYATKLHVFN